jgi:hypothetical protein
MVATGSPRPALDLLQRPALAALAVEARRVYCGDPTMQVDA